MRSVRHSTVKRVDPLKTGGSGKLRGKKKAPLGKTHKGSEAFSMRSLRHSTVKALLY
jgi:hypothetical protein